MSSLQPSRRAVRLTFRVSGGEVQLVGRQRVEMIAPPQVGEPPRGRACTAASGWRCATRRTGRCSIG